MLINLLKRWIVFSIHGLQRSGHPDQIVASGGKFVTPDSGPLTGCPGKKNPALSRRAEETQRLARSCSERFNRA